MKWELTNRSIEKDINKQCTKLQNMLRCIKNLCKIFSLLLKYIDNA